MTKYEKPTIENWKEMATELKALQTRYWQVRKVIGKYVPKSVCGAQASKIFNDISALKNILEYRMTAQYPDKGDLPMEMFCTRDKDVI